MFGAEFFPTPRHIAKLMLAKISPDAQHILEPSAGKGDLAAVARGDYFSDEEPPEDECPRDRHRRRRHWDNAKGDRHVDCIEINPELGAILTEKGFPVVGYDWLDYSGISYYDAVLLNPPYSNGDEHLLKAWDFLHNGEIVCLLNEETVKNPYTERRKRLAGIIAEHGNVEYLDDCFSDAERQTDVRIAMVYLKKVAPDDAADLWRVETSEKQVEDRDFNNAEDAMLAIQDELGNLEHWFNMTNQHMCDAFTYLRRAAAYLRANGLSFSSDDYHKIFAVAMENSNTAKAEFQQHHRRQAWKKVFTKMQFHKWLDKKQQESMLREVEQGYNIPFTAANIQATLDNIFLNRKKLWEQSVANVFDELTRFYKDNTNGGGGAGEYSGWKSNDNYIVNRKIIFPYGCRYESDWAKFDLWNSQSCVDIYNDLDRVLSVLDGSDFEHCHTIGRALTVRFDCLERSRVSAGNPMSGWSFKHRGGKLYKAGWKQDEQCTESQYFEIRFFMKGTVHLTWKSKDLWEKFNATAAAGKKWLGSNTNDRSEWPGRQAEVKSTFKPAPKPPQPEPEPEPAEILAAIDEPPFTQKELFV